MAEEPAAATQSVRNALLTRRSHVAYLNSMNFPADYGPATPMNDLYNDFTMRMHIVDYYNNGHGVETLELWARHVGFEVTVSRGNNQIGASCGVVGAHAVALLIQASDFMQCDVSNAASPSITKASYSWLSHRAKEREIDYMPHKYTGTEESRECFYSDDNVMTHFLTNDEVDWLILMECNESLRERRDPEGAFVNTFDPGLTENDDIRAMTLTMAIEMIARKADAARRSNTSQFGALVSNTDRDSPGTHWFAVAYEIAPADPTSQVSSSKRARR